jgi:glycosyltransferase involved in cell wall biosynthesis
MASIDVAIPCYNYGRFLRDCIGSVQAQAMADLRILVIDNASTDDSVAVARELATRDRRISVFPRRVNLGAQASFNDAVDWADSDYFMILCADDLLAPGALARAVVAMEADRSISFVYGRDIEFRSTRRPKFPQPDGPPRWKVMRGHHFIRDRCTHPVASASVLVRTRAQKQAGYYRRALPYTDDLEMLLRLAMLGSVAVTDAIQGARRLHGGNMANVNSQSRARTSRTGRRPSPASSPARARRCPMSGGSGRWRDDIWPNAPIGGRCAA